MESTQAKLVDVFDFDGTIYQGDSTVDFVRFVLGENPLRALCLIPPLLRAAGRLCLRRFSLSRWKGDLFAALCRRMDLADAAERFWAREKTRARLGAWYFALEGTLPRVLASASPDFELRPAARLLGMDALVCTRVDLTTGRLIGANCRGAEKIRRIEAAIGPFAVRAMYTDDARADGPLLAIAKERYLVRRGSVRREGA